MQSSLVGVPPTQKNLGVTKRLRRNVPPTLDVLPKGEKRSERMQVFGESLNEGKEELKQN